MESLALGRLLDKAGAVLPCTSPFVLDPHQLHIVPRLCRVGFLRPSSSSVQFLLLLKIAKNLVVNVGQLPPS